MNANDQGVAEVSRSKLPIVLVSVAVVAAVGVGSVSLLGGGSASEGVTVAHVVEDGVGDLYLIDTPDDAATLGSEDLVLRDVRVGGVVEGVVDGQGVTYDPFDYLLDGNPVFAYQQDGNDDWVIAVLHDGEVMELERGESEPVLFGTVSGLYTIIDSENSCTVVRLNGQSSQRMATADVCSLEIVPDAVALGYEGESGLMISILRLATGNQVEIGEFAGSEDLVVDYHADGELVLVSDLASTVVMNIATEEIVDKESELSNWLIGEGFLGLEITDSDMTLRYHPFDGEPRELANANRVGVEIDAAASTVVVFESSDDEVTMSVARLVDGELGPLEKADVTGEGVGSVFDSTSVLLTVNESGEIKQFDAGKLVEVGQLEIESEDQGLPQAVPIGPKLWLVGVIGYGGVVVGDPDPRFLEMEGTNILRGVQVSPDARWIVVVNQPEDPESPLTLLIMDLNSGELRELDSSSGFGFIQYSGDHLYYELLDENRVTTKRMTLEPGATPDEVAEGVTIFVPGGPSPIKFAK